MRNITYKSCYYLFIILHSKRILRITVAMACFEALFLKAPPLIRSPNTPYEDVFWAYKEQFTVYMSN